MICDLCGHEYIKSCKRCTRRVQTWGVDGTILLMSLANKTDEIGADIISDLIDHYYIGKSSLRSDKANVARTALRVLGFNGIFTGRIHKNKTDYLSVRRREHEAGYRWRIKKDYCEKCGTANELIVHHIVPISWGGITSDENCITLCINCHLKVHKKISMLLNRELLLRYLEPHKKEIIDLAMSCI